MENSRNINLTEGPVIKTLITLSVPIILANLLQTAYQLTDTFWVGRLGTEAVAAVSISFPVIFLLVSLGGGMAMAGTILVAQYKGKQDQMMTNHIAAQTLLMVMFSSLILAVIGYTLTPWLVNLMGTEVSVTTQAVSYMRISFIGVVFMFTFFVYQSLMRGVGDVKTPMYIVLGTVFLNFILDPLFIFGYKFIPAFGVGGAAVASIATEGLSALIGIILLFKGKYSIHTRWQDFKPDFGLIKKMFRLGFPSSIEGSTRALGMNIMTFLVVSFGTVAIAAYGIGGRILSFIIIPAFGLSIATSTLVGQNIGAGKIERAEEVIRKGALISFVSLSIVGILMFLTARPLAALFIPEETEAILSSAHFIRIISLSFGFIGLQLIYNGAFRGAGNTFIAMVLSIVSLWILQFPIAYILSHHTHWGETGLWLSYPIANVISALIAYLWFKQGGWKNKRLTEEIQMAERVNEEAIIEEGLQ
jgi:putative MATE family efflux protein